MKLIDEFHDVFLRLADSLSDCSQALQDMIDQSAEEMELSDLSKQSYFSQQLQVCQVAEELLSALEGDNESIDMALQKPTSTWLPKY